MDETLAGGTDHERQPESLRGVETGDAGEALLRGLAEAHPPIEHDPVAAIPARAAIPIGAFEERADVGDDVDRRIGFVAIVHDDDGRAMFGDGAAIRIALRPHMLFMIAAPRIERPRATDRLQRIDRNRNSERDHIGKNRFEPRALLVGRNANRAAIGAVYSAPTSMMSAPSAASLRA